MKWVEEIKPTKMENNYFTILKMPIILSIIYYSLLYIQTLFVSYDLGQSNRSSDSVGFAFFFTDISYHSRCMSAQTDLDYQYGCYGINPYGMLGSLLYGILLIWTVSAILKSEGNIGNVTISSLIVGVFVGLLDLIYLVLFLLDDKNTTSGSIYPFFGSPDQREFVITDFITNHIEYLYAWLLFFCINYLIASIILAGILIGIRSVGNNYTRFNFIRVLAIPTLTLTLYAILLFVQTFIGEKDPVPSYITDSEEIKPMAYIFLFTHMESYNRCVAGNLFDCRISFVQFEQYGPIGFMIFTLFGLWVAIKNINEHHDLVKTIISSVLFGLLIVILDLLFFLYFLVQYQLEFLSNSNFILRDYLNDNGKYLLARSLFFLFQFIIMTVLFAYLYKEFSESNNEDTEDILYPGN